MVVGLSIKYDSRELQIRSLVMLPVCFIIDYVKEKTGNEKASLNKVSWIANLRFEWISQT